MLPHQKTEDRVNLQKMQKIGSGTYGIVYLVKTADGKEEYAFKRNIVIEGSPSRIVRELDILKRLRGHPRVVTIMIVSFGNPFCEILSPIKDVETRYTFKDDIWHFLFELAETNLFNWICNVTPTFNQTRQFMLDILLGVEFIHRSGIIHRDLKTQNVVIFKPGTDPIVRDPDDKSPLVSNAPTPYEDNVYHRAKICDFGLAKPHVFDGLSTRNTTTLYYRAPEIAGGHRNYDFKVDCWSVGCMFYEMLFRMSFVGQINNVTQDLQVAILNNLPYLASKYERETILGYYGNAKQPDRITSIKEKILGNSAIIQLIRNDKHDPLVVSTQLDNIITKLLTIDPTRRASITEILNEPFFNDYRDYIEKSRAKYLPRSSVQYPYDIPACMERNHISYLIIEIYNRCVSSERPSWYTHRRFFHAIDLFDRCLRYHLRHAPSNAIETEHRGKAMTTVEAVLYFYCCFYLSIKYFSSLENVVSLKDILPRDYQIPEVVEKLEAYEIILVRNICDYSIYRHTLYESICMVTEDRSHEFEMMIRVGIICLTGTSINGKTPMETALKIKEERELEKSKR